MHPHEKKLIQNLLLLLQSRSQKTKKKVAQKKKVPPSSKLKLILPKTNGQQLKLKSSSITIRVTVGW